MSTMKYTLQTISSTTQHFNLYPIFLRMLLGESFVNVDKDGAESFLAEAQSTVNNDLSAKQTELATIQARMKQLKAQLYAKFGKAINLDEQQ